MTTDLSSGTTVQVINKGNTPFSIQWNSRVHKLEPSKPSYVPVEAAVLWFGDPRSGDSAGSFRTESGEVVVIPDRSSEVRRLCVKYGYQTGGEIEFLTKGKGHEDNNVPRVEVRSLDDDSILPTVLSDPLGDEVLPANVSVADNNDLLALIKSQQQQISALQQHIGFQPSVIETPEGQELPEDDSYLQGANPPPESGPPTLDL